MNGRDGAQEIDLATASACRVRNAGELEKSTSKDAVLEVIAGGTRILAWRGSRESVASIAELLSVAIHEAGGRG